MADLLPCPMCGKSEGYTLRDGSTHRWWMVECAACGRPVDEARAMYPREMTPRTDAADIVWNEAARYAERLLQNNAVQQKMILQAWADVTSDRARIAGLDATIERLLEALQEADTLMGHDDAPTEWRSKWAHLWPTVPPAAGPGNPPTAASIPAAAP